MAGGVDTLVGVASLLVLSLGSTLGGTMFSTLRDAVSCPCCVLGRNGVVLSFKGSFGGSVSTCLS